jgi:putative ABC transport system permease protein
MLKDYFRIAYRSAKKRKVRSWLTMLGIFIGIAAVVSLISLSSGMQNAISQQFVSLGSDKIIVQAASTGFGPPGTAVSVPITKDDKGVIEKVKGVDLVVGRLIRTSKLKFNDETKFSYVVTMPDESDAVELVIEANNYKINKGRLLDNNDKFKVMIGKDFADDFFDVPLELRDKIEVQDNVFEVVGILKKSGNPQQDSTLVVPEETLREILGIENEYDIIPLRIKFGEDIEIVSERIAKALRKHRNVEEGKEDFSIQTPGDIIATLTNILTIIQSVLVGIAGISLLVGGIGIMNTMYTAVLERTKEIGIMKATGAKNSQIQVLFLIESGILGMFGGIIGVSLGFTISRLVEFIAFKVFESYLIKASFSFWLLGGALLFAFTVGMLSGWFPASQASKLKPVDALRK